MSEASGSGANGQSPSRHQPEEPPRKRRVLPPLETYGDGGTELHRAAREGDSQRVRELLSLGYDTRATDRYGRTPLHTAVYSLAMPTVEILADVDATNEVRDREGRTPLHLAASSLYLPVLWKLLSAGANTRVQDKFRDTPLHTALYAGWEAGAELLADADALNGIRNASGRSPLDLAEDEGFVGVIRKLLTAGDDTHLEDGSGRTPIHCTPLYLAVKKGCVRSARKLLWGDAPLDYEEDVRFPLTAALAGGKDEVAGEILARCAWTDIAVNWEAMNLPPDRQERGIRLLSECEEEIRRMREVRIEGSSVSFYEVATRHACRTAPRLRVDVIALAVRSVGRNFPAYADRIVLKLREVERRKVLADRCREVFSLLRPPLPAMCTDVIFSCLSDQDMRNFACAMESLMTRVKGEKSRTKF
ncbi:serine/threonine-protein phosphatase 6 regulatory ankyrin repeat subunit C-like [Uloborus diversus]|uniref:serine/threonine-protein phosphatase 6 regulatory ankyrin repeat subunit C-like n=1 Tax=Uloborus diversus TaxID=327109 RepID=UPI0024094CF0|nr:serine/threonine-protein phosphatase 6 regulatory ankyrin repeat subunit C-like [Uloborus diversus]